MTDDRLQALYDAENILFSRAFPLSAKNQISDAGREEVLKIRKHIVAQIKGNGYIVDGNDRS